MAQNPPSFRFPFATLEKLPPEAREAHLATFNALTDIYQAIALQKQNSSTSTTTVNETVLGTSGTSKAAGVTSFNGDTGAVTFYPSLGEVNDQSGQTSYTTQTQDAGALVILNDASPVSVVLNFAVGTPWVTNLINEGTGTVTITATSGTINGGSSFILLPTYFATIYFDGINWEASTLPIVPVNSPAVLHQFMTGYNAGTGLFSRAQPAFTDVSGIAATTQIGTGTPTAGKYVDGAAGAWTTLPTVPATIAPVTGEYLTGYNAGTGLFSQSTPAGITVTITTAALTVGGTTGSQTFTNGLLTAQTPAT